MCLAVLLMCRLCVAYASFMCGVFWSLISGHWHSLTDHPVIRHSSLAHHSHRSPPTYRICVTYISAGTQQPPRQRVVEITHKCDLYAICINLCGIVIYMWSAPHHITYWTTIRYLLLIRSSLTCMPVNGLIFILHLANSLITYRSLITHTIHTRCLLLIRLCLTEHTHSLLITCTLDIYHKHIPQCAPPKKRKKNNGIRTWTLHKQQQQQEKIYILWAFTLAKQLKNNFESVHYKSRDFELRARHEPGRWSVSDM